MKKNIFQNQAVRFILIILVLVGLYFAYNAWQSSNNKIFIDQASIFAPEVDLTSPQSGILKEVYVVEGETVLAHTDIARVNNALIRSSAAGQIVTVNSGIGRNVAPGETLAVMIDPTEMTVVGQLPENKGLISAKNR